MLFLKVSDHFKFIMMAILFFMMAILFFGVIVVVAMPSDRLAVLYGMHNSAAPANIQTATLSHQEVAADSMTNRAKNGLHVIVSGQLAKKTLRSAVKSTTTAKPIMPEKEARGVVHTVFLGAFKSLAEAAAIKHKIMNSYGIKPIVVSTRNPGYTHVVLSGAYSSREEASAAARVFQSAVAVAVPKTLLKFLSGKPSYIAVDRSDPADLMPVVLDRQQASVNTVSESLEKVDRTSNGLIRVVLNRDVKPRVVVRLDDGYFSLRRRIKPQQQWSLLPVMRQDDYPVREGAPDERLQTQ